jgi:hypothetical protein
VLISNSPAEIFRNTLNYGKVSQITTGDLAIDEVMIVLGQTVVKVIKKVAANAYEFNRSKIKKFAPHLGLTN